MPPDLTIADAWQWAQAHEHSVYLVGARQQLVGSVMRSDLDDLRATDKAGAPVATITQASFVHVHPDQTMDVVLERFEESGGVLAVVSRTDAHRLEGVITADSLTRRRPRSAGHARPSSSPDRPSA
jgi:CBS domain-containing protein